MATNPNATVSASPTAAESERAREQLILVVDDSSIDLRATVFLLERRANTRVVSARNGQEALGLIEQLRPDLVVTDMQMPEMDGLQLVEAVGERFPYVPTVLVTAHGSEEIAIRALQRGAANYVRKQDAFERLVPTVDEVLALTAGKRMQHRLSSAWQQTEFQFCLENDPALIQGLVAHLRQYLSYLAFHNETTFIRMSVALHEALANAMFHGNLELDSSLRAGNSADFYRLAQERRHELPYAERRVHVTLRETAEQSCYIVRDEGRGFDVAAQRPDPTDPSNVQRPGGRGLFLIHMFMDEVAFNETGNEIKMVHYRTTGGSESYGR